MTFVLWTHYTWFTYFHFIILNKISLQKFRFVFFKFIIPPEIIITHTQWKRHLYTFHAWGVWAALWAITHDPWMGWEGMCVVWPGIATISYENVKGNNEEHQCEGKRKSLLLRKIKHFVWSKSFFLSSLIFQGAKKMYFRPHILWANYPPRFPAQLTPHKWISLKNKIMASYLKE